MTIEIMKAIIIIALFAVVGVGWSIMLLSDQSESRRNWIIGFSASTLGLILVGLCFEFL